MNDIGRRPVALIPARGGSKRLPEKNLKALGNRSLVEWAIDAAKQSGLFHDRNIYVSTDEDRILHIAHRAHVRALRRPVGEEGDHVTLDRVITGFRSQAETTAPIYLLVPTAPFRNPQTMREAWATFCEDDQIGTLMSLVPDARPPAWSFKRDETTGRLSPLDPALYLQPRHDVPVTYHHDGSHMIVAREALRLRGFILKDPAEAIDIDTAVDLAYAQFLLREDRIKWIADARNSATSSI